MPAQAGAVLLPTGAQPHGVGTGMSRTLTARSTDNPRLSQAEQSQVQGPSWDSSPGPAGDRTRRRSEDGTGAEASLETEQGAGMPVAELRQGAQGWGWGSQTGLVKLKPLLVQKN